MNTGLGTGLKNLRGRGQSRDKHLHFFIGHECEYNVFSRDVGVREVMKLGEGGGCCVSVSGGMG